MLSILTFIYPLCSVIFLPIILLFKKPSKAFLKKVVAPIAFVTSALGYSFVPIGEPDLIRYYQQIEKMRYIPFLTVIKADKDFLYTRDAIFWIIAQIGCPQLLAYFVGFTFYWIAYYILVDQINRSKKQFTSIEIAMLFLIPLGTVPLFSIISNVRCVLAFALILFASYRDLVQNKKNFLTYAFYILPVGLHTAAIIFLALRFIQSIVKYIKFSFLIGVAAFSWVITFAYDIVNKFASNNFLFKIISSAVKKAYNYLLWNEGGWATAVETSTFNVVNRIYGTLFIIFSFLLLFQYNRNRTIHKSPNFTSNIFSYPMVRILFLVGIAAIGCLNIKTGAFWRFAAIFTVFSPIFLIPILESDMSIFKQQFIGLSISVLLITAAYLIRQVHSLNIEKTVYNFLSASGIKIIYDCIKASI